MQPGTGRTEGGDNGSSLAILGEDRALTSALEICLRAAGHPAKTYPTIQASVAVHIVCWPTRIDLRRMTGPTIVLVDRTKALASPSPMPSCCTPLDLPAKSTTSALLWMGELLRTLQSMIPATSKTHARRPAYPQTRPDAGRTSATPQATDPKLQNSPLSTSANPAQTDTYVAPLSNKQAPPSLIAIGISTGGPDTLEKLFASLKGADLPPIAIVQHIPSNFVDELASRLQRRTGYPFLVAEDGMPLEPGTAYLAPGTHHMRVHQRGARICATLTDEPRFRGHRPAAEILFESCALLPGRGIGVIMTGMGTDGATGLLKLRRRGWNTIGQDQASCMIYGMPRAALQAGAVERELPLEEIGPRLQALCAPVPGVTSRR